MAASQPPESSFKQLSGALPAHLQLVHSQLQCLSRHSDIRYQPIADSASRFELLVPFCYEVLRWQVEYQRIRDTWVPDLVFSDPTFNPLLSRHPTAEGVAERLRNWEPNDERQLHSLLKRILPCFMAHQRALIQNTAATDSRLQFELDTVAGDGGPARLQLLYLQGQAGNPSKAIFVVGIDGIDFMCFQPYLTRTWAASGGLPANVIEKLQSSLYLRVAYQPHSAGTAPSTSLHMPEQLEAVVGRPKLPAWGSGMSLIEYLPEVVSTVQRHCSASAATASLRQDLLSELGQTKLGPVIEADPIGARSGKFCIIHEGVTHALFIDISPGFPEEQPCLTLQWGEGRTESSYQQYPWSPRWDCREMARRIYSFVKEQIQKHHKKE